MKEIFIFLKNKMYSNTKNVKLKRRRMFACKCTYNFILFNNNNNMDYTATCEKKKTSKV